MKHMKNHDIVDLKAASENSKTRINEPNLMIINQAAYNYIKQYCWPGVPQEPVFQDTPSDFELWARQIRAEAGIIDPPRKPVFGGGQTPPEDSPTSWNGSVYSTYGSSTRGVEAIEKELDKE